MNCLELKPKRGLIKTDHRFLAKIPLLPNRYLWELQDASLALMASEKRETLLIVTDNERFLEQYRKYYQERFEVTEHGDDYSVASDFETIYGQVRFSHGEIERAEEDDEDTVDATEDALDMIDSVD
jgi:hypothetical protein